MVRRSLTAAVVVGSVLVMLNQADVVFSSGEREKLVWKVPLTYVVPFLVSTWEALSNARR